MKNRIAVVHYQPIELFPPVMNFMEALHAKDTDAVQLFTTRLDKNDISYFEKVNCRIFRFPLPKKEAFIKRLLKYFYFNFSVLLRLIRLRPHRILYYETYSAFPVYIYKRFVNPKVEVFIHCHEYFSPEWWRTTATSLLRFYFKCEKSYLYPNAKWISHTNNERLQLFSKDIGIPDLPVGRVFPNYPPSAWRKLTTPKDDGLPIKMVYVGSFGSMDTLYIKEAVQWVKQLEGKATLDVYSFEIPPYIKQYIDSTDCPFISLKGPVNYYELPGILQHYQVGLILYKGTTKNFTYNAPNKLFEYLACGLDVWYPTDIEGIYPYDSAEYWPKVVRLDFNRLLDYNIIKIAERKPEFVRDIDYTCEKASQPLVDALLN